MRHWTHRFCCQIKIIPDRFFNLESARFGILLFIKQRKPEWTAKYWKYFYLFKLYTL